MTFEQKTACVKGWSSSVGRAAERVRWSARARAEASRVCWLNRRTRLRAGRGGVGVGLELGLELDLGLEGGEEEEEEEEDEEREGICVCEANHLVANSILSRVCPPSICHASPFSRLISQRPGQRTCSRPRLNSAGRGSVTRSLWPRKRR